MFSHGLGARPDGPTGNTVLVRQAFPYSGLQLRCDTLVDMLHRASSLRARRLREAAYESFLQEETWNLNLFRARLSGEAPTQGRMNSIMTPRRTRAEKFSGGGFKTAVRLSMRGTWGGKFVAGCLALCAFVIGGRTTARASDRWETLQAIHMIENPTNSTRIGSRGELGPYQFRPSTWKIHTKKPFSLAANRQEADRVAIKHYDWIKSGLERSGVEATPYRIALAWNAGLEATIRDSVPASSHRYAERVEAVANDLRRQQLVRQP